MGYHVLVNVVLLIAEVIMERSVSINFGGFFLLALTLIFVVAKLWGVISWSWVWVLAPLWIGFALWLFFLVLFLLFGAIAILGGTKTKHKGRWH